MLYWFFLCWYFCFCIIYFSLDFNIFLLFISFWYFLFLFQNFSIFYSHFYLIWFCFACFILLLLLFCFVSVGTSELAFIVFHMIWNALKDTQIGRAFSNSQGDDNSCRGKKKKRFKDTAQRPKKYFHVGSLIPGFELS